MSGGHPGQIRSPIADYVRLCFVCAGLGRNSIHAGDPAPGHGSQSTGADHREHEKAPARGPVWPTSGIRPLIRDLAITGDASVAADVLVIGAGTVGLPMAVKLAERGH